MSTETHYLSSWPKYLQFGDSGPTVKWLQTRLKEQGAFRGSIGGNFGSITRNALLYFQSTHLGEDGRPLDVDGLFGPKTLWALLHPSGDEQRSFIDPLIPTGLSASRAKFLRTLAADHRSGQFYEDPDGSNRGPRISAFSRGTYWCCFYQSDAWKRTFGSYPNGTDHGHCLTFWREAKRLGQAIEKDKGDPLPGDFGVILYRNASGNLTGTGHIFALGCVSEGFDRFNTFGGNEGNRLKHGLRNRSEPSIVGWIDLHGDDRDKVRKSFSRGVVAAGSAISTAGGTR